MIHWTSANGTKMTIVASAEQACLFVGLETVSSFVIHCLCERFGKPAVCMAGGINWVQLPSDIAARAQIMLTNINQSRSAAKAKNDAYLAYRNKLA